MTDTAEAEEAKLEPKSESSDIGPCKIKLTIEVAAEKVKAKIEAKYKELNEGMVLPGFRKGHAPRHILERKYGKQILDEVKFNLLTKSFEEVKEARKLEPLGEPDLDPEKLAIKEGDAFTYDITIEVRPQLTLKAWVGLSVKKIAAEVSDADLEVQLRELAESRAEWLPVEDGAAKAGDQVVADFELSCEGKRIDNSENNALVLNEDISFYGLQLADFHKALVDKKAGDRVEYGIKLPDTWAEKDKAGKDATIATTIKSLKRKKLPEIDAEFAKAFDMDSVDELKDHWRKRLAREKEQEAQHKMGDAVVELILKENEFPLPEGLIKAGTEEAVARVRTRLILQGKSPEEAAADTQKMSDESRNDVVKAIRERFVLEHIATKEKIYVTEDQVEDRLQKMASSMGKWPHEVRQYLEEQGLMTQLRRNMREEAVREFLVSKAKVE